MSGPLKDEEIVVTVPQGTRKHVPRGRGGDQERGRITRDHGSREQQAQYDSACRSRGRQVNGSLAAATMVQTRRLIGPS